MYLILITFVVLISAGLYLAELSRRVALIYISTVAISFFTIALMKLNIGVWLALTGFIDAILLIHIFKGNVNIDREW